MQALKVTELHHGKERIENKIHEARIERIEKTARWTDDVFEVPGLGIKFGWDAVVGLIPGVGDFVMTLASFHLLIEAIMANAPKSVLFRMGTNVLIEAIVGAVPLLGDVFDVFWKANRRNARILKSFLAEPVKTERRSRTFVALFVTGMVLLLAAVVYGCVRLVMWIF